MPASPGSAEPPVPSTDDEPQQGARATGSMEDQVRDLSSRLDRLTGLVERMAGTPAANASAAPAQATPTAQDKERIPSGATDWSDDSWQKVSWWSSWRSHNWDKPNLSHITFPSFDGSIKE